MRHDKFTLRKTFLKPIAKLNDEQLGRLFRAIYQYQCGETPRPSDDIAIYFDFFVAEFEEEEEKRRIRAEKAAERRRKKAEQKNAVKKQDIPELKPNKTDKSKQSGSNQSGMDSDQRKRKFLAFKKNMQNNYPTVYRAGGRKLSFSEYEALNERMPEEKVIEHIEKLNLNPETYNKNMSLYNNIYILNQATV